MVQTELNFAKLPAFNDSLPWSWFILGSMILSGCGETKRVMNDGSELKLLLGSERSLSFARDDQGQIKLALSDHIDTSSTFINLAQGRFVADSSGTRLLYTDSLESDAMSVANIDSDGTISQLCQGAYADRCRWNLSKKSDPVLHPQLEPVHIFSFNLNSYDTQKLGSSFLELNPLALASPDQEEAGTCLFMASTGAMEILLNRDHRRRDLGKDGSTDLSERFLMNVGRDHRLQNWKTDSVLLFNLEGGALLNRDYRYTKGWTKTQNGILQKATAHEPGAQYGTHYNWIYELSNDLRRQKVPVPRIKRKILYEDPDSNLWNTGIMEPSIISKVKKHLKEKKTPVIAIYNHYGYWHAAVIIGFDDDQRHGSCPFVKSYIQQMRNDPVQSSYVDQIESAMDEHGGCTQKGVFYVRDSIYEGSADQLYDYDPRVTGDERPYSKVLVELEYEWLLYMGNHAYTVELE